MALIIRSYLQSSDCFFLKKFFLMHGPIEYEWVFKQIFLTHRKDSSKYYRSCSEWNKK